MSTATAANVKQSEASHWYFVDGRPCYELPKKDGKGMKSPTLADARKLNLLPGVSTILRVLDKPALTAWKIEQACLAILTTPRLAGEADDAFVNRVLNVEEVQEEEGKIARDRGTEIHDALESIVKGESISAEIAPWVEPAAEAVMRYGKPVAVEKILIGPGYGGRTDLITEAAECDWIIDYKSTKKLPDKVAWDEHKLQLAAYAKAQSLGRPNRNLRCANVYISTVEQGKFVIHEHQDHWISIFENGFAPLVQHWQWSKGYKPQQ